jgi:phage/plasmid-associated DNA primase
MGLSDVRGEILPPQVSCKYLYDSYVEWCFENGFRPMNSSNFGKEVKRAFPNVQISHLRKDGIRERTYIGISIRRED